MALTLWREDGYLNGVFSARPPLVPWYRKPPAPDLSAWSNACNQIAEILERLLGPDSFTRQTAEQDVRLRRQRLGFIGRA
jgi:hypothetical protein